MNPTLSRQVVSEAYHPSIIFAMALQIPIAILCLLMLDGGVLARVCGVAMAAHWLGAGVIMARRPFSPTLADRIYLRAAFLPIFAITFIAQGLFQ